jgi:hypothetical protein
MKIIVLLLFPSVLAAQIDDAGLGYVIFLSVAAFPHFVVHEIGQPFRRMFPPLNPLRGRWDARCHGVRCTLYFAGQNVYYSDDVARQRNGSMEKSATGARILWPDGQEWVSTIKHRHILVKLPDGTVAKFHYVPPGP